MCGESLIECVLIRGMLPIVYILSEGSEYMFVCRVTKLVGCLSKSREDIRHSKQAPRHQPDEEDIDVRPWSARRRLAEMVSQTVID